MLPKRSVNREFFPSMSVGGSQLNSLELSKTPAQRPYRGPLGVKPAWKTDLGERLEDELNKENASVDEEGMGKSRKGKGKGEGGRGRGRAGGRRKGGGSSSSSDENSSSDDDEILDGTPQKTQPDILEAGRLEDMIDYLDAVASDNSDDDEEEVVEMRRSKRTGAGGAVNANNILAGGTTVPVARSIPTGHEHFHIQGQAKKDTGGSRGGRKRKEEGKGGDSSDEDDEEGKQGDDSDLDSDSTIELTDSDSETDSDSDSETDSDGEGGERKSSR
ncbi:hypothetical protein TrRE_jg4379 [Triparma retinervis]|uniref:Uncharacterized protein n=1 Tax=Triparma retinervis TaxID=2557542 RepID=A0A9W7DVQ1_9STRA|nr:hypothetical protein TrRE_jg4379 [Triparma retinervis]